MAKVGLNLSKKLKFKSRKGGD